MRYLFPSKWRRTYEDQSDLAVDLGTSVKELRDLKKNIPKHYSYVTIRSKGKLRKLKVPDKKLRSFQKVILKKVLNFKFPNQVQGGVSGRSIITNAKLHLGKKWLACIDLKNFFPSVHYGRVMQAFLDLDCSPSVAKTLCRFTTFDYELPQGSPTSPVLANLILYNFDSRLIRLCKERKLFYSRYFDDITISGNQPLRSIPNKVAVIAKQEGFEIYLDNPKKFRVAGPEQDRIVTGLIVNGPKLRANEEFISKLHTRLKELQDGTLSGNVAKIHAQTLGMISFLKSVDSESAESIYSEFLNVNWSQYGITT